MKELQLARMKAAMNNLKAWYPWRIVWGAIHPETLEIKTGANATKRQVNNLIRQGWEGYTL